MHAQHAIISIHISSQNLGISSTSLGGVAGEVSDSRARTFGTVIRNTVVEANKRDRTRLGKSTVVSAAHVVRELVYDIKISAHECFIQYCVRWHSSCVYMYISHTLALAELVSSPEQSSLFDDQGHLQLKPKHTPLIMRISEYIYNEDIESDHTNSQIVVEGAKVRRPHAALYGLCDKGVAPKKLGANRQSGESLAQFENHIASPAQCSFHSAYGAHKNSSNEPMTVYLT